MGGRSSQLPAGEMRFAVFVFLILQKRLRPAVVYDRFRPLPYVTCPWFVNKHSSQGFSPCAFDFQSLSFKLSWDGQFVLARCHPNIKAHTSNSAQKKIRNCCALPLIFCSLFSRSLASFCIWFHLAFKNHPQYFCIWFKASSKGLLLVASRNYVGLQRGCNSCTVAWCMALATALVACRKRTLHGQI